MSVSQGNSQAQTNIWIRELNAEVFVTLTVREAQKPFVMLKSLLCLRLEYFRAMFEGNFEETTSRTSSLPDIETRIFGLVLQWFYTGHVLFSDGTDSCSSILDPSNTFTEAVKMFVFADQYDIRALRLAIFDIIAPVCAGSGVVAVAGVVAMANAIRMLPESSGLRRLTSDCLIYDWTPKGLSRTAAITTKLHSDVLARIVFGDRRVNGDRPKLKKKAERPWEQDMCQYHEHLNDEGRQNCS